MTRTQTLPNRFSASGFRYLHYDVIRVLLEDRPKLWAVLSVWFYIWRQSNWTLKTSWGILSCNRVSLLQAQAIPGQCTCLWTSCQPLSSSPFICCHLYWVVFFRRSRLTHHYELPHAVCITSACIFRTKPRDDLHSKMSNQEKLSFFVISVQVDILMVWFLL